MGNQFPRPPGFLDNVKAGVSLGLDMVPGGPEAKKAYEKVKGGVPIGDIVQKQVDKAPDDPSRWILNTIEDLGLVTAKTVQGLTTPANLAILGAMSLGQEEAILPKLASLGFSAEMARGAVKSLAAGYQEAKKGNLREAGRLWGSAGVDAMLLSLASGKKPRAKVAEAEPLVEVRPKTEPVAVPKPPADPFEHRDALQKELEASSDPARQKTLRRQIEQANRSVESASVADKASTVPPAPWGTRTELDTTPIKGIVPPPGEPVLPPPEVIQQPRTIVAGGEPVSVTPDDIRAYVGAKTGKGEFSQVRGPKGDIQDLTDDRSSEAERIRHQKITAEQHKELFPGQPYRAGMTVGEAVDATPGVRHPVSGRKYSSTQIDLPKAAADKVEALAKSIPDSDLSGDGREDRPHVTVKYGLHDEKPEALEDFLKSKAPITLKLGKTAFFNPSAGSEGNDVVIVGVDSPELHALNRDISSRFRVTDTHPEYKPHITLAYVKPGLGQKYAGNTALEGLEVPAKEVLFSSRNGQEHSLKLSGTTLQPPKTLEIEPGWKKSLGAYEKPLAEKYLKSYKRNTEDAALVADPSDPKKFWVTYKPKPQEALVAAKALPAARKAYSAPSGPERAPWEGPGLYAERRLREINREIIDQVTAGHDAPEELWAEHDRFDKEVRKIREETEGEHPQIEARKPKSAIRPSTGTPETPAQAADPAAPPQPAKESTPEDRMRLEVNRAGMEWTGVQKDGDTVDGFVFTDPKTKSSFFLPPDKATKADIERRAAEGREQYDRAKNPDKPFEVGNPIKFVPERNGVLFAGPTKYPVEYGYVELADAIPSHDARSFSPDPRHPGQQRVSYEFNPAQKAKLQEHFMNPEPDQLLSDGVTGVEGPPIMTPDGKVAGGNGRTMLLQMLYGSDKAKMIRDATIASAHKGGAEGVESMKQPIRVRRIKAPDTQGQWMKLTDDLNLNPAAEITAPERAMSVGRQLSPSTIKAISSALEDIGQDTSIRDLMTARPVDFVRWLTEDGALATKDRIRYIDSETGGLNEEGRALYESAILGSVVKDVRLLERGSRSVISKLASSLGPLARLQGREDEWDVTPLITEAAQVVGEAQSRGLKVSDFISQKSLFGEDLPKGVKVMAEFLDRSNPNVKKGLRQFANESGMAGGGQALLGTATIDPWTSFNAAFVEPVEAGPPMTKTGKPKAETPAEQARRERQNADAKRRAQSKMLSREEYEDAVRRAHEEVVRANEEN